MTRLLFAAPLALAVVLVVCMLIDGRRRDRWADPTIELEEIAHRWATEPTRKDAA